MVNIFEILLTTAKADFAALGARPAMTRVAPFGRIENDRTLAWDLAATVIGRRLLADAWTAAKGGDEACAAYIAAWLDESPFNAADEDETDTRAVTDARVADLIAGVDARFVAALPQ